MKNILLTIGFLVLSLTSKAQTKYTLDSTELTSSVVKDSLDIPWEIIWGPDDYIWTTERFGRVSRINPKTGEQQVLLNISSQVYYQDEAGMLGMVLHPNFKNNPKVFIAYTYLVNNDIKERLVKFDYDGTKLIAEDTLIENIAGNTTHIGCRLLILNDNTLLMSTGDAQNQSAPQDTNMLLGKFLRMNLDGTIPNDNPNPNSYIWSIGHRNAQGLCLAPNGKLYSSEHGPTTDDELNVIEVGRNYGWPTVKGFCNNPTETSFCTANNVKEPLFAWTPTIAPSDIVWYSHEAIPEFKNKLLMTVLKDKSLIVFTFNENGDSVIAQNEYLSNAFGRLRDICVSPEGVIYIATNGNSWSNTNPFTHKIIALRNENYTSAVKNISTNGLIQINPNPVVKGEKLQIKLPLNETGQLTIVDLFGKVILSETISNNSQLSINTPKGFYAWKVVLSNGTMQYGKLMIE